MIVNKLIHRDEGVVNNTFVKIKDANKGLQIPH